MPRNPRESPCRGGWPSWRLPRGPRSRGIRDWRGRLRRVTSCPLLALALRDTLTLGGLALVLVVALLVLCAHAGHGTPSGACAAVNGDTAKL